MAEILRFAQNDIGEIRMTQGSQFSSDDVIMFTLGVEIFECQRSRLAHL